jgi:hypothetical protein
MHLNPAAVDAAIRLLDELPDHRCAIRSVKDFEDVVETATEEQE